jgi:SAM-dependent methyltransferase
VVGLDIAPKMILEAKKRASASGIGHMEFMVGTFENLASLKSRAFDLALSNFGGLNCVGSLDVVSRQLAAVVRPGGYVVALIMPPYSLWEIVAGLFRLNFRSAFRRARGEAPATGFGDMTFMVRYYSPLRISRAMQKWFRLIVVRGLNIISPPPHAMRFKSDHPGLSMFLERAEKVIDQLPVIRSLGDHSMIVLQRR